MKHPSIVRLMLDHGATDYNRAMVAASYNGQLHIVRLMLDCGADNINETMETAAKRSSKHSRTNAWKKYWWF